MSRIRIPGPFVPLLASIVAGLACQQNGTTPAEETPPIIKSRGSIEMVLLPAGTFAMGCRGCGDNASDVHTVSVDSFLMDRYEVTQAEYQRQGLPNPSHFKGPDLPVEQVNWPLAATYCNARSRADGFKPCYNEADGACDFEADGYRLPTEAEWEYACRAGSTTDYSFGNDLRQLGKYAWFADNAERKTHPVGRKEPNRWGLYDMHGNVAEWCNDVYDVNYYRASPAANPRGPADGRLYVLRGGSWKLSAESLRSGSRQGEVPGFSDACLARDAIGFRCVRKAPSDK
jgi:formylglycine-generating enzyme required for sulfatase activity